MDERAVFERFHEALEVEPRAGAYERFRAAFINRPAAAKRRPVFRLRFSRMSLRIAAAVAVAAIAIALVAGYLAAHHAPSSYVPAATGSSAVKAYQTMMRKDDNTMAAGTVNNCNTVHDAVCMPAIQRTNANLRAWIADIDAFQTPSQFKVIDAQMRLHLAAAIAELNITAGAITAGNQDLFHVSLTIAGNMQRIWIDTAVGAITGSHPATTANYIDLVASEKQNLAAACSTCTDLAGVVAASNQLAAIQSALVANAAPNALAGKDLNLQSDLAHADDALTAMSDALIANDHAALNSALNEYQRQLQAVVTDMTAIAG